MDSCKPASSKGLIKRLYFIAVLYSCIYIYTLTLWQSVYGKSNIFRTVFFALIILGFFVTLISIKKITITYILFFTYYFYVVLNYLLLPNNSSFFEAVYSYLFMPLVFFAAIAILRRVDYTKIIKIIAIFGTITSSLAFYEYITSDFLVAKYSFYYFNGQIINRSCVFADSPLSLGCMLAVSAIASILVCKKTHQKKFMVMFLINAGGVLLSGSRGPLIGLCVSLLFIFIYGHDNGKDKLKSYYLTLGALVVVLIIALTGFMLSESISVSDNPMLARLISIFNWNSDVGNVERTKKWSIYFDLFLKHSIVGIGIDGCNYTGYGVTESGVLQRFVEMGLFGSIIFYSILMSILIPGYSKMKRTKDVNQKFRLLVGVSIVVFILVEDAILQIFGSTIVGTLLWFGVALTYTGTFGEFDFFIVSEKER